MRKISFECSEWSSIVTRWENSELFIVREAIDDISELGNLILIDWWEHSSNIEAKTAWEINNSFEVIWPWKDWLIITNINSEDIILIVPLADCWWIWFKHKSGSSLWMIHAWYKWVCWDIIWNFIEQIQQIDILENFLFYMAPMVGKNYEFSKKDYQKRFKSILEKYNLDPEKYFESIDQNTWYLHLKNIILDILKKNWIKVSQIKISHPATNNPKNNYASHRLHTLAKRIQDRIKDKYWEDVILKSKSKETEVLKEVNFTPRETEILESWNYIDYLFGRRNLFIVKTWEPIVSKK